MGLACAKVVAFDAVNLSEFCSTFKQQRFDKSLLPRNWGEKVADRPDEGVVQYGNVQKTPPHPAFTPNSFAATLSHNIVCKDANELGERGF